MGPLVVTLFALSCGPANGEPAYKLTAQSEALPLSTWSEEQFTRMHYRSALLEGMLADAGLPVRPFRHRFFPLVIGMANALGEAEEPQKALTRALRFFREEVGFHTCGTGPTLRTVLPSEVLKKRCGTPLLVTTLFLALLDRQVFPGRHTPRLLVTPYRVPGAVLVRYSFDTYHVTLAPGEGLALLSDREVAERWRADPDQRASGLFFRSLNNRELAGFLLAELGAAYGEAGNQPQREHFLRKALTLYPDSPRLALAGARMLLRTGRSAEALTRVEAVLKRFPTKGEALFLKAAALYDESRKAEAKQAFHAALRRGYTEKGKVFLYLARIASEEGSLAEFKRHLLSFRQQTRRKELAEEIEATLKEMQLKETISVLKREGSYERRFEAVDRIAQHPHTAGIEELIRCLTDSNRYFRAYAWHALCKIAGRRLPLDTKAWWEWFARTYRVRKHRQLWAELRVDPEGPAP